MVNCGKTDKKTHIWLPFRPFQMPLQPSRHGLPRERWRRRRRRIECVRVCVWRSSSKQHFPFLVNKFCLSPQARQGRVGADTNPPEMRVSLLFVGNLICRLSNRFTHHQQVILAVSESPRITGQHFFSVGRVGGEGVYDCETRGWHRFFFHFHPFSPLFAKGCVPARGAKLLLWWRWWLVYGWDENLCTCFWEELTGIPVGFRTRGGRNWNYQSLV